MRLLGAVARRVHARELAGEVAAEIRGDDFGMQLVRLRLVRERTEQGERERHRLHRVDAEQHERLVDRRHVAPAARVAARIGDAQQLRGQGGIAQDRLGDGARAAVELVSQTGDRLDRGAQPGKTGALVHQGQQSGDGLLRFVFHL